MRLLWIASTVLLFTACDGQDQTAVTRDNAPAASTNSESESSVFVKVSQIPAQGPVTMDDVSASMLESVAAETLTQVKKTLAGSMHDPREAAKLENATSSGSFGTAGGVRLAIVRIRVGEFQPITVILGPSANGLTEIYCSDQQGKDLSLQNNECAEAIRTNFGGDVVERQ